MGSPPQGGRPAENRGRIGGGSAFMMNATAARGRVLLGEALWKCHLD